MDTSPTRNFARWSVCLHLAHFAYGNHKNTYPAIHTAAVSTVIAQLLLYIV